MPIRPAETSAYGNGPQAPQQAVEAHSPILWVERTFPLGKGETREERQLEARIFVTQPATVKAALSRTINLGNYESIRIEVGVTLPCYTEEVETGIEQATAMVGKFITDEEAALRRVYKKSA